MSDTYIRTFDTGVVRPVYKGDWDSETQYEYLNIVRHNAELWINITIADTPLGDEPLLSADDGMLSTSGEWHRLSSNADTVFGLTAEGINELWNYASDPLYENRIQGYIEAEVGKITVTGAAVGDSSIDALISEDCTTETLVTNTLRTFGGILTEEIVEINEGE